MRPQIGRRGGPPQAGRTRPTAEGNSLPRSPRLARPHLETGRVLRYNIRMNTELKVRKIGNSAGVVLPKELLARLHAGVGDTLSVTNTPQGIELSVRDAEFEAQMEAAREVMARRRNALRELAK